MLESYLKWHRILWPRLVREDLQGRPVFLEVDDELIETGGRLAGIEKPSEDFCQAVRLAAVQAGRVDLGRVKGRTDEGHPRQFLFLCAMALAAYRMQDSDQASEINYFVRLRQILGLTEGSGRPNGLKPAGIEEPLWQDWNRWLVAHGFIPTACQGKTANYRYLNYPLSQVLLRKADKDRLHELFAQHFEELETIDDPELLAIWLYDKTRLTKHLQEILDGSDSVRYEAAIQGIEAEFRQWLKTAPRRVRKRPIRCGLYRDHDDITLTTCYYLYPRIPRNWEPSVKICASIGDQSIKMEKDTDHPDFFLPIFEHPLSPEELSNGVKFPLENGGFYSNLQLEKRKFWVLVSDPDGSGHATLAKPRRYEAFIVLVVSTLWEKICKCLADRPIGEIEIQDLGSWQTEDWWQGKIEIKSWNKDLEKALRKVDARFAEAISPVSTLKIGLQGGLRCGSGKQFVWIKGYEPEIIVHGTDHRAQIVIQDEQGNEVLKQETMPDTPVACPSLSPGRYLIEAAGHGNDRKSLQIISWDDVLYRPPDKPVVTCLAHDAFVSGAVVIESVSHGEI